MRQLTDDQIQILAEKLDNEARFCSDYALSEDSPVAEFVQSFGYGDGEMDLDGLDDDIRDQVYKLKSFLSRESFRKVMESCCALEFGDSYRVENTIYAMEIGETEHQIDDLGLRKLTKQDRELVRKACTEAYLGDSDCIYTNHSGDYWRMILDVDKFQEKYNSILKSRPSQKRSRRRTATQLRELTKTKAANLRASFRLIQGGKCA